MATSFLYTLGPRHAFRPDGSILSYLELISSHGIFPAIAGQPTFYVFAKPESANHFLRKYEGLEQSFRVSAGIEKTEFDEKLAAYSISTSNLVLAIESTAVPIVTYLEEWNRD